MPYVTKVTRPLSKPFCLFTQHLSSIPLYSWFLVEHVFFFRNSFSQVFLRKQLTLIPGIAPHGYLHCPSPRPWPHIVSPSLCTWPMRTLDGWPLLALKVSLLSLSLSPLLKMMLFILSSPIHLLILSVHTLTINKGFNVYIQDKICWELFKSRFVLRQSPYPRVGISLLKRKQPKTSVKIPSTSLDCGRLGQGILKII